MTSDKKWRECAIHCREPIQGPWAFCPITAPQGTRFIEKAALDEANAKIERLEQALYLSNEFGLKMSAKIESQEQIIEKLKGAIKLAMSEIPVIRTSFDILSKALKEVEEMEKE